MVVVLRKRTNVQRSSAATWRKITDDPLYPVQDNNGNIATTPEDLANDRTEFLYSKFSLGDFDSADVDAAADEPVTDGLSTSPPADDG